MAHSIFILPNIVAFLDRGILVGFIIHSVFAQVFAAAWFIIPSDLLIIYQDLGEIKTSVVDYPPPYYLYSRNGVLQKKKNAEEYFNKKVSEIISPFISCMVSVLNFMI